VQTATAAANNSTKFVATAAPSLRPSAERYFGCEWVMRPEAEASGYLGLVRASRRQEREQRQKQKQEQEQKQKQKQEQEQEQEQATAIDLSLRLRLRSGLRQSGALVVSE
jgi:hypothetical protein